MNQRSIRSMMQQPAPTSLKEWVEFCDAAMLNVPLSDSVKKIVYMDGVHSWKFLDAPFFLEIEIRHAAGPPKALRNPDIVTGEVRHTLWGSPRVLVRFVDQGSAEYRVVGQSFTTDHVPTEQECWDHVWEFLKQRYAAYEGAYGEC